MNGASISSEMIQAFKRWAGKSGRLEVLLLAGSLLAVAGLWAFGLIAAKVMEGDTQRFDERVLLALRNRCRSDGDGPCRRHAI